MTGVGERSIECFLRERLSGTGKLHDNGSKFRNTSTAYEKLSLDQLDIIRKSVHNEFKKFIKKPGKNSTGNQDIDARHPTMSIIQKKLQANPNLPNWSLTTTFTVLRSMGFKVLIDIFDIFWNKLHSCHFF